MPVEVLKPGEQPLISVVIPVKNGDAWLDKTLAAIYRQTLVGVTEVIVIDSGSTDGTFDILARYPVTVLQIASSDFNHGGVRNLGAKQAQGKYVAMTVQDAEPSDAHWLHHLLDGFEDERVAGVCGLQVVPHEIDKNPVDWFRPLSPGKKRKYAFSEEAFGNLSAEEQKQVCSWDNVNAMYRRDILLEIPFRAVAFAEDALWAKDALGRGYSIVYNPAARVNHYHFETPDYTFRRSLTVYYHFYRIFGTLPEHRGSGLVSLLKNIKLLVKESSIGWAEKWKWLNYNRAQRKATTKAIRVIQEAVSQGNGALEKLHKQVCGDVPQALKPKQTLI